MSLNRDPLSLALRMADLYTVETLARDTGVKKRTIKKFIKKGVLPAANLGSWLFPRYVMSKADVFDFLKRRRQNVPDSRKSDTLEVV